MAAMEPRRRRRRQGLRTALTFGAASALLAGAAAVARPGEVTSARDGTTQAGGTVGVFWRGDRGYYCIKIPSLVAVDGVLLALGEGRRGSCKDSAPTDLVAKRSLDGGRSWGELRIVASHAEHTVGNAAPIVVPREGGEGSTHQGPSTIVLPFCKDNKSVWLTRSADLGLTWSLPRPILEASDPSWTWVGLGPPAGIRLSSGRLLVPAYRTKSGPRLDATLSQGYALWSDDGGRTWARGPAFGGLHQVNEGQVAELASGRLLLNARGVLPWRLQATSDDGGASFKNVRRVPSLGAPVDGCEGSLLRRGGELLYSGPTGPALFRRGLALHSSSDDGGTYRKVRTVFRGASGYSALADLGGGGVGLLFETANRTRLIFEPDCISFAVVCGGEGACG